MGVLFTAGADIAMALAGRDVVVVGGANSAGQAVVHLAKRARRVIHAVRGNAVAAHMSAYLSEEIERLPNVDVRLNTEVIDGIGSHALEGVVLRDRTGATARIRVAALFVMIGAAPHTAWLDGIIERDRNGFIITGPDLPPSTDRARLPHETSVPGVFAIGDVRLGSTKRIASALGDAAIAMPQVHRYIDELSRGLRRAA
jgi:thioredoxin reductase (NADPH)